MQSREPVVSGCRAAEPTPRGAGHWRQALHSTLGVVDVAVPDGRDVEAVRAFRLGHLKLATAEGGGMRLARVRQPIEEDGGLLVVILVDRGAAVVEQDDRQVFLKPGEMVFYDLARPMSLEFPDPFRVKLLVLPRQLIGLREDQLHRITATSIRPDATMSSLVAAFLTHLVDTAADLPAATGVPLASSAIDLLTLLAEEHLSLSSQASAGLDRLLEIKRFIEQNIKDPDLTPQAVAHANSISVRYLHKLFRADGGTVGQWIQRCRLQKCRSELAGLDATRRSISAVAHQWGFTSAPHFSRAFRSLYGISPAEWRDPGAKLFEGSVAASGTAAA
ncbi:helix-turn-helix domain-containing protein [Streptomyces adustus]|uniref:helix-turn-helix domain-containing protein n=1 Tax=Streptomyces adustus TaxID=1609272 RepID=UPI0013908B03